MYKPKKTDIFRVIIKEPDNPKQISAFMYVISFIKGVPYIVKVSGAGDILDEMEHNIVGDQMTPDTNNHYELVCTTGEKDPTEALQVAMKESPEYFI